MKSDENFFSQINPTNEESPTKPKEFNKNILKGLTKNILVNQFSYILKTQLKLHALDEKQLKFVNDLAFDKTSEMAIKREMLRKKLMNEISESFFDKKPKKFKERLVN